MLGLPEESTCYNQTKVDRIDCLCILLKEYSYPNRLGSDFWSISSWTKHDSEPWILLMKIVVINYPNTSSIASLCLGDNVDADAATKKELLWISLWDLLMSLPALFVDLVIINELYKMDKKDTCIKISQYCCPKWSRCKFVWSHDDTHLKNLVWWSLKIHARSLFSQTFNKYGDSTYPIRPQLMCPSWEERLTNEQQYFDQVVNKVRLAWILNNHFKF